MLIEAFDRCLFFLEEAAVILQIAISWLISFQSSAEE